MPESSKDPAPSSREFSNPNLQAAEPRGSLVTGDSRKPGAWWLELKLAKRRGPAHNAVVSDMPTYEYECQKCGHHFEQFQSMRDEPLAVCPKCRKKALKRLLGTGAGLIFKGSGFYITDYKKAGAKTEGGETKSESKPAEPKSSDTKSAPASGAPGAAKSHSKK